jgi:hypothetical protein
MTCPPRLPLLALAALLATLATVGARAGGGNGAAPMPRLSCAKDTDCPGCETCQMGSCANQMSVGLSCMCDSECQAAGTVSCEVSGTKPLCGGQCGYRQAARALICGTENDVTRVEPFPGRSSADPGAATLTSDRAVVIREPRP